MPFPSMVPEKIHDSIRGKGTFRKVTEILDKQSRKVMVHVTVCKSNKDHLREIVENFIHRKNVRGIYFCFFCPSVKQEGNVEKITLKERDGVIDEIVNFRKVVWQQNILYETYRVLHEK